MRKQIAKDMKVIWYYFTDYTFSYRERSLPENIIFSSCYRILLSVSSKLFCYLTRSLITYASLWLVFLLDESACIDLVRNWHPYVRISFGYWFTTPRKHIKTYITRCCMQYSNDDEKHIKQIYKSTRKHSIPLMASYGVIIAFRLASGDQVII